MRKWYESKSVSDWELSMEIIRSQSSAERYKAQAEKCILEVALMKKELRKRRDKHLLDGEK